MSSSLRCDWMLWGMLVVAGILLLTRLENGYLWQDEAETAVLARNTQRFGYPKAFDGQSYLEIPTSFGVGPWDAWIYSPWLPFYLLAGVFVVFGESTWVARIPFALCGLASVYLTWRLAARLTDDRRVHRLSGALLTCSVPFLLHMRQCRYYAMVTALVVGACLTYVTWLKTPSRKFLMLLGIILTALFHTNFACWFPVLLAMTIYHVRWGHQVARRQFLLMVGSVLVLTIPWGLFFYRGAFVGTLSMHHVIQHLAYYVRVTNKFLMPLGCMLLASAALLIIHQIRRHQPSERPAAIRHGWLLGLVIVGQVGILLLADQRHLRYLISLFPLLCILQAWWLTRWLQCCRLLGWTFVILTLFTTVPYSGRWHVPLMDLTGELTHRYVGPMEGVVDYLQLHGRNGEVVKIPYDDRTIMFYTKLAVERPSRFLDETYPNWIVLRRGWIPAEFFTSDYFHRIEASYERIELDAPDLLWQNREDPGSHHFRTVTGAPRVVLYRKRMS